MKITTLLLSVGMLALVAGCSDETKMKPSKAGVRGENCQASNDCKSGLVCVSNVCSANDLPLTVEAKTCYQVDCAATADCCNTPDPDCANRTAICTDATSDLYNPTANICYDASLCTCAYQCQDSRCVYSPTCTEDSDCLGLGGTCSGGKCVECATDGDCNDGESCKAGVCKTPCKANEECPLLNACDSKSGECVEVGCTSDRECVAVLNNRLAVCGTAAGSELKQCQVPCETNAECSNSELCVKGVCTNIGCQSDEECRAQLDLAEEASTPAHPWVPKAVCK